MPSSPHQYHSIINHLSIGVLIFDSKNKLVYINSKGEELLDTSEKMVLGARSEQLFSSSEYHIETGISRAREENLSFTDHKIKLKLVTGETITVNLSITNLSNTLNSTGKTAEGNVLVEISPFDRYLQIHRDEQIISQNEVATDMVRSLAHEIKNPLGGLRGAAQLLSKELDAGLVEYTDVIIEEADRLTNLVDRMLGSSAVPLFQSVNIHSVLERVRQLVQAETDTSIIIKTDYDPSIPDMKGDKDQLIQVFLNVVRNAVQAIPSYGEIVLKTRVYRRFTIADITHKLGVKVDIIDNGIGIEQDMLEKIFYPMITGRTEGTGLGLSIAQTNAQNHGGIIEVSSEPGKTVFSIILPIET